MLTETEPAIEINQTKEYLEIVQKLSEFIVSLPLSSTDNNKLINLMLEQTKKAREDAFLQGFELGIQIGNIKAV